MRKLNICKAFANKSSTNIKLWKSQLSKMIQSGGIVGILLGPLLRTGLPLIKNVMKPLGKCALIPPELTVAASAADAGIHKKVLGSVKLLSDLAFQNNTTTPYQIKKWKTLWKRSNGRHYEKSQIFWRFWFIIRRNSKTIQNEVKEQKGGNFLAGKAFE